MEKLEILRNRALQLKQNIDQAEEVRRNASTVLEVLLPKIRELERKGLDKVKPEEKKKGAK